MNWVLPFAAGFCTCALLAKLAYYLGRRAGRRAAARKGDAWQAMLTAERELRELNERQIDWDEYEKAAKAAGAREP